MTLDDAYSSGASRHAAAPRPRPAAFCCLARLRHVLASAAIAPSLLPPTSPPPWPSQSPPPSLRRHAAYTRPPPSIDQGMAASAACIQHPTRRRNPCRSRARWRAPHMLISPVKGCRRWSEGASAGSERVWAPQLRMRRQPMWLSSPPGVAIGRGLQPAVQARVRAAVRRRPRATQLSPARSEWSWPAASPDGAGVALRRRALAANTEGLPADVKSKLVLGLSCVAEGLHAALLSEFDYAGEELRS